MRVAKHIAVMHAVMSTAVHTTTGAETQQGTRQRAPIRRLQTTRGIFASITAMRAPYADIERYSVQFGRTVLDLP